LQNEVPVGHTSASIGGIFITLQTLHFLWMRYYGCKFGCDLP